MVSESIPLYLNYQQRKKFQYDCKYYGWVNLFLFKRGVDGFMNRSVQKRSNIKCCVIAMILGMVTTLVHIELIPRYFNHKYIGITI